MSECEAACRGPHDHHDHHGPEGSYMPPSGSFYPSDSGSHPMSLLQKKQPSGSMDMHYPSESGSMDMHYPSDSGSYYDPSTMGSYKLQGKKQPSGSYMPPMSS